MAVSNLGFSCTGRSVTHLNCRAAHWDSSLGCRELRRQPRGSWVFPPIWQLHKSKEDGVRSSGTAALLSHFYFQILSYRANCLLIYVLNLDQKLKFQLKFTEAQIFFTLVIKISAKILSSKRKTKKPETARHISTWNILLVLFCLRVNQYRCRNYICTCWGGLLVLLFRQFIKTIFFLPTYLDMRQNLLLPCLFQVIASILHYLWNIIRVFLLVGLVICITLLWRSGQEGSDARQHIALKNMLDKEF